MTSPRRLWEPPLFAFLRLSPLVAPAVIVSIIPDDPILASLFIQVSLIALVLVVAWNMVEGAMILYLKAKASQSAQTNGYLIVSILCGILTLILLQYFRSYVTQSVFLLMLASLSLRGMARSGWENGRPTVAFLAAIGGHSLLSLTTFLSALSALTWQSAVCSLAVGLSLGAVEASWYGAAFAALQSSRVVVPLYRIAVCGGPIIIATMALAYQLSPIYVITYFTLVAARRVVMRATSPKTIPCETLKGAAGIYILFLTMMTACVVFTSWSIASDKL